MDKLLTLSEEDFLLIEEAIASNARGRAFLRMRDRRAQLVAAEEVKRLIRGLGGSLRKSTGPERDGAHIRILRQELQEMSVYIQQTRSEIAALRPDDSGNNRIMAATGELDAIVTATERATSDILNAAERIQACAARLPREEAVAAICAEIEAQVTEILTACSFQDITGQRTTKVVNTLRYIEKRVNSMIEVWGIDGAASLTVGKREPGDDRPDSHLLNGPSSEGVSQAEVDALLAEVNAVASGAAPVKPAAAAPRPPRARPTAQSKPPKTAAAVATVPAVGIEAPPLANGGEINQNDIDALFD